MSTPIKNSNSINAHLEPWESLVSLFLFSESMDYSKDYLNMNKKAIS